MKYVQAPPTTGRLSLVNMVHEVMAVELSSPVMPVLFTKWSCMGARVMVVNCDSTATEALARPQLTQA